MNNKESNVGQYEELAEIYSEEIENQQEPEEDSGFDTITGSAFEKETIINYNNGEPKASFYTLNRFKRAELLLLAKERPDDVKIVCDEGEGRAIEVELPKKWIKIRPPRILTEEQHKELVERGKALAARQKQN